MISRKSFWRAINLRKLRRQIASTPAGRLRLVVAANGTYYPGWLHTDIQVHNIVSPADWEHLFTPNSLCNILGEHVWEHLTEQDGEIAARQCHRFLRTGGRLRIAVPDGLNPDSEYIDKVRPGGTGPGADDHKVLYDASTLSAMLSKVGFSVSRLEYYDRIGSFHATEWDPGEGMVVRSVRFDERNRDGKRNYTSLIVDALKE